MNTNTNVVPSQKSEVIEFELAIAQAPPPQRVRVAVEFIYPTQKSAEPTHPRRTWHAFILKAFAMTYVLFFKRPELVRQVGPGTAPLQEHEWKNLDRLHFRG
jgi:hypothetical protein